MDQSGQLITSLFTVVVSYCLCEKLDFSGAIASVVCGVLFSTLRDREEQKGNHMELEEFDSFWNLLDDLLNSLLYAVLGLSFVSILQMPSVLVLSLIAIVCSMAARAGSLWAGTWLLGPIPDGYDRKGFVALFTWSALRGGLSLALAVSTSSFLSEETYVIIIGCTYAVVFFTTVVQGLTIKRVFRKIPTCAS